MIIANSSKTTIALLCAWAPLTCFALWAVYRDPSFVISMAVSPDGSRVAVSRFQGRNIDLEMWSTGETPRIIGRLSKKGGRQVAFVDNSRILIQRLSIDDLFEPVIVFALDSWKQLWQLPVSNFPCKVECGGGRFAIDEGGTVRVFDASAYQEILNMPSGNLMRLSPNGKLLAIEDSGGWRCVSVDTGAEVLTFPADTRDGCFSTDGQMFVCSVWGGGLAMFDVAAGSQEVVAKSKGLVDSCHIDCVTPTDAGIVFLDRGDDHLKIWEGNPLLARTLFPQPFPDANIVPVASSEVWVSQPGGHLSSLDLATGKLKPLQLIMRGYASGLWLLWCVGWVATRVRQTKFENGSAPTSLASLGGPALDILLTLVPVIAYFSLMRNAGIWLTGWDTNIALGGMITIANISLLWLVLGQRSITSRLLWSIAGLGTLVGVTLALEFELVALRGVGVGMLGAALIWWAYRWWATWRLAPSGGVIEAGTESKWLRWSIRNLLVLTAASAGVVQVALLVDFKQLMSWKMIDFSNESKAALITFLHAVIPIVVCFAPWSYIKRLALLSLLLVVYWYIWELEWVRHLAIQLAWSSFAVCGILWLHSYRIIRTRQLA